MSAIENAPTFAPAMVAAAPGLRIDESREEACSLRDRLYAQAEYYRRHAPACTADIALFQDAAALLDTYQAGLTLVTLHPVMQAEVVRWVSVDDALPDSDRLVLLFDSAELELGMLSGWRRGEAWLLSDSFRLLQDPSAVTHWAYAPVGPAVIPPPKRYTLREEVQS